MPNVRKLREATFSIVAVILILICGCSETSPMQVQTSQVDYDQLAADRYAELQQLNSEILDLLPDEYDEVIASPVTYINETGTDNSLERMDQWQFEQQRNMIVPALNALLDEECTLCLGVMGDANAEAVNSKVESLRNSISSAETLSELYEYAVTLENHVFSGIAVECTAENKDTFAVSPVFFMDETGDIMLTLYTNVALPGFEDSSYGYLLKLVLDGGKTEQAIADSIYSHEYITYESSYAVTFNLSKILTNVTAQDFLAGRNRVTFTLFALDNSFSFTEEYYKLRYTESNYFDIGQLRASLAEIILDEI